MIGGAAFTVPTEPDITPILRLHRGHDGFIAFTRNEPGTGRWQQLCSVRASELGQMFPSFVAPLVNADAYFSLNGFYAGGRGPNPIVPQLPRALHKGCAVRWLTTCYADLDCYQLGLTPGGALGLVVDMIERGDVPPVSMVFNSGRGLWLFWVLRADDNDGPVRAWPETVGAYQRIQRALWTRLQSVNADPQARDVSRVARVPGSVNRKPTALNTGAAARVAYWIPAGADGRGFAYRLDELAALMGVRPAKPLPDAVRKVVDPKRREAGVRGHRALNNGRLDSLERLIAMRQPIGIGTRNRTALILASFLHRCKVDAESIATRLHRFGAEQCSPPLERDEIASAIRMGRGCTRFSNATLSEWLGIERDDEAAMTGWPKVGDIDRAADDAKRTRADAQRSRRELIVHFVQDWIMRRGEYPTAAVLHALLADRGIDASPKTIHNDMRRLESDGLIQASPRRHRMKEPQRRQAEGQRELEPIEGRG